MADERIEVEWIATANKMMQTLDKMDQRFEKQDQALKKLAQTSDKTANAAAGSFNKLEQELKENEAALKKLERGTAAFDAQKKKVDQMRKAFSEAKGEIGGIGEQSGGMLSSAIGKVAALAAGMASFQTIVTAVVAELDKVRQLKLDAAQATRSVEQTFAEMAVNVGAADLAQARNLVQQNAAPLGVTQEGLANLIAAGMSGGAESINEAMDLAGKTLKLTAGDAAKAAPLMSGMLSLAATTGNRDFESILGQLSQFQKAGRGEDMAMSVNNMSTAIAAANVAGERVAALGAERTLELGGAISQLLQDPTMAVTGTTMRQFITKMDSFVPAAQATLDDGSKSTLPPEAIDAFNKLGTFDERVAAMQQNPELAKQFLSRIEDNQGKSAIRQIVTGTDAAKELLAAAESIVTDAATATNEYKDLTAMIAGMTALTRVENVAQANIQGAAVSGTMGAEGQAMKIVDDTLAKVNLSGLDVLRGQEVSAIRAENAGKTGVEAIQSEIAILEGAKQTARFGGFAAGPRVGGDVSERDRQLIDRQIQVLNDLAETLRNINPAQRPQAPAPAPVRPREAPLPAATVP